MFPALIPDQDHLRQQLGPAEHAGRIISDKTARELATWLAHTAGSGFDVFLTTGVVTPELFAELARFYDLRQPEVERWLDGLTRYVFRQHAMTDADWRNLRREGQR
jgi:hypothetical protein